MTLALGSYDYFQDIKRMALDFFHASPYQPLGVDESRVEEFIHAFLQSGPTDRVTILWMADRKPVGLLAATAETNLFNRQRFAGELVWWIDPTHRKSKAAPRMMEAFEYWAKYRAGCQFCTLVDLMGNLDNFYKRKGYERRETTYLKVL